MSGTKQKLKQTQRDLCRALLRKLITQVDAANEIQDVREYSVNYNRGRSFSLTWWSGYEQLEHVLLPAATPITEKTLTEATQMMDWQIDELRRSFGRYGLEPEGAGAGKGRSGR